MYYGVSYYPEHKNEEELRHDIKLLKESGINTVRMGEFAWCRFEPRDGEFQFDWLDQVVLELSEAGIQSIICTPTACPPAWMLAKHEDLVYIDNRGVKRPFGGRRHYCYNHEAYRIYSQRIARKLGEHYGANPNVIGFQIDNEPAQEVTGRCCCNTCKDKFRNWLREKYGTLEEFNERIGGIFWSSEYTDFNQVCPPINTIEVGGINEINAFYENPTIRIEFERFSSESQIEYQNIQVFELKNHTNLPITTNATGLATNSINNYESTKELSNYAFDYYPSLREAVVDSFPYSFARGIKQGKPFWILEFMSGGGHRLSGSGRLQPNVGALKQAVLQSFAHGAEMMLHFQFRTFPFGAEQLNYAIVDIDGIPRRRYFEMRETAKLLNELKPLENAKFRNEVAVCVDYDVHWSLRIKPVNDPVFRYLNYCGDLYHTLAKSGLNADVISYDQDFSSYKFIVLPTAFILAENMRQKLKDYVANGGTVLATFLSSVKNKDNTGYKESLPAGLTDLFGVTVEEVEPVFDINKTNLRLKLEDQELIVQDVMWSELLSGRAKMIGTYCEDYKDGCGVISENLYGQGRAYYLGTALDQTAMSQLFTYITNKCNILPNAIRSDKKLEVVKRYLDGKEVYFLFNFEGSEIAVSGLKGFIDYLTGESIPDEIMIEKNGTLIVIQK